MLYSNGWDGANWLILLLPQMDQVPLFKSFNSNLAVSASANAAIKSTTIAGFLCPSDSYNSTPLQRYGGRWARGN
jgi:hypothetical protein